jgi:hypothetical protein
MILALIGLVVIVAGLSPLALAARQRQPPD